MRHAQLVATVLLLHASIAGPVQAYESPRSSETSGEGAPVVDRDRSSVDTLEARPINGWRSSPLPSPKVLGGSEAFLKTQQDNNGFEVDPSGPLLASGRRALVGLRFDQSAGPQSSGHTGKSCARGVALGAAIGAGLGLASGYLLLASSGGSDSYAAILRGTTIAGVGIGAFVGLNQCP